MHVNIFGVLKILVVVWSATMEFVMAQVMKALGAADARAVDMKKMGGAHTMIITDAYEIFECLVDLESKRTWYPLTKKLKPENHIWDPALSPSENRQKVAEYNAKINKHIQQKIAEYQDAKQELYAAIYAYILTMLPLNSTVEQAKLVWEMCETIDADCAHLYIQELCDFYTHMKEEENA